jgi:uncharacterized membrane protein
MLRMVVEVATGVLMMILGILFLIYIPNNPANLATDLIFMGAGVLIIKRAFESSNKRKLQALAETKNIKKQKQNTNKKK